MQGRASISRPGRAVVLRSWAAFSKAAGLAVPMSAMARAMARAVSGSAGPGQRSCVARGACRAGKGVHAGGRRLLLCSRLRAAAQAHSTRGGPQKEGEPGRPGTARGRLERLVSRRACQQGVRLGWDGVGGGVEGWGVGVGWGGVLTPSSASLPTNAARVTGGLRPPSMLELQMQVNNVQRTGMFDRPCSAGEQSAGAPCKAHTRGRPAGGQSKHTMFLEALIHNTECCCMLAVMRIALQPPGACDGMCAKGGAAAPPLAALLSEHRC